MQVGVYTLLVFTAGCRIGFDAIEREANPDAVSAAITGQRIAGGWGLKNLTTEGQLDWRHWGYNLQLSGRNEKLGATLISDFTHIGGGVLNAENGISDPVEWTDGTPVQSASDILEYILLDTGEMQGDGFSLTVGADVVPRTLTLYTGNWCLRVQVEAMLEDASWVDATWEIIQPRSEISRYVITYAATAPGQTLAVMFTVVQNYCTTGDLGEIKIMAATVF